MVMRKDYRSAAAHVRGLGSAKHGVGHWWVQRLSAVALVPLTLWLVAGLILHTGADYEAARAWLAQPGSLGLMALTVLAGIYHAQLGLQVIIEDYVHGAGKWASLIIVKLAAVVLAVASLVALIEIGFGK